MPFSLPITDPVLVFGFVMLIILVVPLLFARLRVPGVVGLILAGALVGPSALGLLARGETMELLGIVGLLYLMFTAGLSIDRAQFSRLRRQSLVFGTLSLLVPLLLALGVGTMVLGYPWPTAWLLGSIVGSHTLLAYPIVRRLDLTRNASVTMTMGGTLVTDGVSLGVLAVVVAASKGTIGMGFWASFLGLVLLFVAAVAYGLPRLGRWFFRTVRDQPDVEFVFLLAVVFLTAYLASMVGLAPIIGAFLAGIALNRLVPEAGTLMGRIQFAGNALFIPFFLISVGMLVDFSVLFGSLAVWGLALTFTLLVLVGKTAAGLGVSRLFGYTPAEGWLVTGLSVPQAAATLAVTMIGFEMGLFSAVAVNAVVVMILITCILGPWLVERYGRRVALLEEQRPFEPSAVPQRILVPLANPETAARLVDMALMIRDPASEQPIFPLAIARDGYDVQEQVAQAERLLGHAVVHAAAAEVPAIPVTRVDYNVASGIVRAVKERLISTIVIGWHGEQSTRQRIFGSVLDQLLEDTREMVLVTRVDHPLNTIERMVVVMPPLVERESGLPRVLRALKNLAGQLGAGLRIVAAPESLGVLRAVVPRAVPQPAVDFIALESWHRLVSTLAAELRTHDLLVLVGVREGSLAWRPALDRLPRLLAQQFSDIDLVVLYPPEQPTSRADALDQGREERRLLELLAPERVTIGLEAAPLERMLTRMLAADDQRTPDQSASIAWALAADAPEKIPELRPGIVLYHAHLPGIREAALYVGTSASGIMLPDAAHPVYVVFALVTPEHESPEVHLRRLAALARMLQAPGATEALRTAGSVEDVRALLRGGPPGSA